MSKKIIWMQGFDHLPQYSATASSAVFISFVNKYSLISPWEIFTTSTGKIGTASVQGKSYKGVNTGLTNTGSRIELTVNADSYPNQIVYVGVRVSASNSLNSSYSPFTVQYSGGTLKTATHVGGGEFSYYCEIALNTKTGELRAYSNGQQTTDNSVISSSKYATMVCPGSLGLSGVGLVYSDFYIAVDDDTTAKMSPFGNLFVGSCTAQRFSGNASAYNTLGLDIVTDLNSIYDSAYQDVGGFLHMTTAPGTLKYNAVPTATDNVIAVQTTGLTSPPAEGCALAQKIYLNGVKQSMITSKFSGAAPSYVQYNTVTNFSDWQSGAELAGLEVVINAAKT
ncbi:MULTISPECIES: hypothetical protein [Enterobacterales]|uniref:hypothetical protein n=1 Tax=Enterobacterales TaxID=91347 RepID=UPI002ED97207